MALNLDYYYGSEAEQFTFYRIPKVLFTEEHFKGITVEAKVLYSLLLDRMSLSFRNGWLDEERRVFIYFTLNDAMNQMCCGRNKAVRLFSDLELIGLIERKKQGQGKPTKIYVKNFLLPSEPEQRVTAAPPTYQEVLSATTDREVLTSEKEKSAHLKTGLQDFPKPNANNTEKNKKRIKRYRTFSPSVSPI